MSKVKTITFKDRQKVDTVRSGLLSDELIYVIGYLGYAEYYAHISSVMIMSESETSYDSYIYSGDIYKIKDNEELPDNFYPLHRDNLVEELEELASKLPKMYEIYFYDKETDRFLVYRNKTIELLHK